jgi:hypothetical protein
MRSKRLKSLHLILSLPKDEAGISRFSASSRALPVLVDRDDAAEFVDDDERLAAIVTKFLTAVPSPSGRSLTTADLLAVAMAMDLGRRDQSKLGAAAIRTVLVCHRLPGKTAQSDCAGSDPQPSRRVVCRAHHQ